MALPQPENWYSTDLGVGSGFPQRNFEQFVAYFRILPKQQLMNGKREEANHQMEVIAARLTGSLRDLGYTITQSRATAKPQFGNFPAQAVMIGFVTSEPSSSSVYRENKPVLNQRVVDSNGGIRTGVGGSVNKGQVPTTELMTAVSEFKSAVDTMLATDYITNGVSISLIKLDYQGVTFGANGIHFPNP